jgi:hypothetical protein
VGTAIALLIAGWLIVHTTSSGRVTDSFASVLFSGTSLPLYTSLDRILSGFRSFAPPLLILAVPLIVGLFGSRRPKFSIFLVALGIHFVTLIIMFLDAATAENHLVDLVVLVSLVVGTAVSWAERSTLRDFYLRLVAVAAIWGVLIGAIYTLRDPVSETIAVIRGQQDFSAYSTMPLREQVTEVDFILASDPYIPISRGHRPVVLEPLLFLRLAEDHPEFATDLADRINRHEFTKVVLVHELSEIKWYATFEFGLQVHGALSESYELGTFADGYYVYVPKGS